MMSSLLTKTVMYTLAIIAISVSTIALSACNTVEGLGKDIQRAGQSIEGASK